MSIITARHYDDESTTEIFKFVFYCEYCGKVVSTHESTSDDCCSPKFFESPTKRRMQELQWLKEHKLAFEKGSREALKKLNRCECCGSLVCDDCTVIDDESGGNVYCTDCFSKKNNSK